MAEPTKKPSAVAQEAHELQCIVVTPEQTVLDEVADFIVLPIYDGELGVLPGRAALIGRLGFGRLRLGGNLGGFGFDKIGLAPGALRAIARGL